MKELTVKEVEYVALRLAQELMTWNEPIPDFSTRFPNILESCLSAPFQSFSGRAAYKGFVAKGSALFYFMIKNHPFQNGNKRIAITTILFLLYKNKKWIKLDNQELYNFAVWVAQSNPKVKDATIQAIQKFLKSYIVDL